MIVIPMAGQSSRFFKAGYDKPKYMLKLNGESVFFKSISSFSQYFSTEHFVFIIRDAYETKSFIQQEILKLGIKSYDIVNLQRETMGQAETVVQGLADYSGNVQTVIFNIDTFRPGFTIASFGEHSSGYLETFIGGGKNWSNVLPLSSAEKTVKLTAEKQEISNLCCTGLYTFTHLSDLRDAFIASQKDRSLTHNNEFYIAPLYNHLIKSGLVIHYSIVEHDEVIFCGTPDEFIALGGAQP